MVDLIILSIIFMLLFLSLRYLYINRHNPCYGCNKCQLVKEGISSIRTELRK